MIDIVGHLKSVIDIKDDQKKRLIEENVGPFPHK